MGVVAVPDLAMAPTAAEGNEAPSSPWDGDVAVTGTMAALAAASASAVVGSGWDGSVWENEDL